MGFPSPNPKHSSLLSLNGCYDSISSGGLSLDMHTICKEIDQAPPVSV